MALTQAITGKTKAGDRWMTWGTFNAASVTGGDIDTGLLICESILLTHEGSSVETDVMVVNETLPAAGNAITFVCNTSDTGYWFAIGR